MELEPIIRDNWGRIIEARNPFQIIWRYSRYFRQLVSVVGAARAAYLVQKQLGFQTTKKRGFIQAGNTQKTPSESSRPPKLRRLTTPKTPVPTMPYASLGKRGRYYSGQQAFAGNFIGRKKKGIAQQSQTISVHSNGEVLPPIAVPATPTTTEAKRPVYFLTTHALTTYIRIAWARMVVKEIAAISGVLPRSFATPTGIPDTSMYLEYFRTGSHVATVTSFSWLVLPTETWEQCAQRLRTAILTFTADEVHFTRGWMERKAGTDILKPDKFLYLDNAKVAYKSSKYVVLQNRTGAGDPTELNTNNAEHNPIRGYLMKSGSPIVRPAYSDDVAVTPIWRPDDNSGLRNIPATDASYSNALANGLSRVDPHQFRKCYSYQSFILQPGSAKKYRTYVNKFMSFNDMFTLFVLPVYKNGVDAAEMSNLKGSILVAAEKVTQTGTGTAPVTLGYDIMTKICFHFIRGKGPIQMQEHFEAP